MSPYILAAVLVSVPAQAPSVKFGTTPAAAIQSASKTNGLVMLYFSQPNCPACSRMQATFRDPAVVRLVQPLNPQAIDTSTAAGQTYSKQYGVSTVPKAVFVNGQGRFIGAVEGYHSPALFVQRVGQIKSWPR